MTGLPEVPAQALSASESGLARSLKLQPAMKVVTQENWWLRDAGLKRPSYLGANGRPLTSASALKRITALRIPPAWQEVHISPDPRRKIQAWGFDSKGR